MNEFRFRIGDQVTWQGKQGKVIRRFVPGRTGGKPIYHVKVKRMILVLEEDQLTLVGRQERLI
jgi:hypothetical protein